jgi:hypothetical protein
MQGLESADARCCWESCASSLSTHCPHSVADCRRLGLPSGVKPWPVSAAIGMVPGSGAPGLHQEV